MEARECAETLGETLALTLGAPREERAREERRKAIARERMKETRFCICCFMLMSCGRIERKERRGEGEKRGGKERGERFNCRG